MAVSRSKSGKLARLAIQVDTTQFLPQHTRNAGFFSLIHSVNRTALIQNTKLKSPKMKTK